MGNRFIDTNYFKSPFVRGLPGKLKSFYSFIICDCDGSGIWNMDMQAASMYIGFDVSQKEFEDCFLAKGKAVNLGGGKFFFPDFIDHQYPSGLQAQNKAHKNFINTLTKYGLIDSNQQIIKNEAPLKEPLEGSHVQSSNGNGNGLLDRGVGKGDEKLIIPRMCKVWYEKFPTYTSDKQNDYEGMGKILQFIYRQANSRENIQESSTQEKIINTLSLVADQVSKDNFWVNKPLKSIANHIQEFYNKIKNPLDGKSNSSSGKRANGYHSKTAGQEIYADKLAKGLTGLKGG